MMVKTDDRAPVRILRRAVLCCVLVLAAAAAGAGEGHDHGKEEGVGAHQEAAPGAHREGGHEGEGVVELAPERLAAQGIRVEALQPRPVGTVVTAPAELRFDERRRVVLSARAAGWAEVVKVFANQRVKKGQLLARIYSPEFLSAQNEYLLIRRRVQGAGGDGEMGELLAAARERLRLLGLSAAEIERLGRSGKPYRDQHIHSPMDGTVVVHKINAGDAVQPGQVLYVVADLRHLWAELALTEGQLGRVAPGQPVTLTVKAFPGRRFSGRLLSVGARLDEATRTIHARAEVNNPELLLRPGMFASAEIQTGGGEPVLALPQEAVLRSPDGDWVVFVELAPGRFKPQEVRLLRNAGSLAVVEGLAPGTRVVTAGAFFVQSELAKAGFEIHQH